jgi:cob(I)alamin adenosyltransferase
MCSHTPEIPKEPTYINLIFRKYNGAMSDFFTRTGDDGYTGILGEGRIPKYDPRTEAVGTLDESTAMLGFARALCRAPQSGPLLLAIQRDLYHIMAEISASPVNAERFRKTDSIKVSWVEANIKQIAELVEMPNEFIIPGDSLAGAAMSIARSVVRRAERNAAYLMHHQMVENTFILMYLNRLSSLCFVLELLENQTAGHASPTLAKEDLKTDVS